MKKDDGIGIGGTILGIILLILLMTGKLIIGLAFGIVIIAVLSIGYMLISFLIDLYKISNINRKKSIYDKCYKDIDCIISDETGNKSSSMQDSTSVEDRVSYFEKMLLEVKEKLGDMNE